MNFTRQRLRIRAHLPVKILSLNGGGWLNLFFSPHSWSSLSMGHWRRAELHSGAAVLRSSFEVVPLFVSFFIFRRHHAVSAPVAQLPSIIAQWALKIHAEVDPIFKAVGGIFHLLPILWKRRRIGVDALFSRSRWNDPIVFRSWLHHWCCHALLENILKLWINFGHETRCFGHTVLESIADFLVLSLGNCETTETKYFKLPVEWTWGAGPSYRRKIMETELAWAYCDGASKCPIDLMLQVLWWSKIILLKLADFSKMAPHLQAPIFLLFLLMDLSGPKGGVAEVSTHVGCTNHRS